GCALDGLRKLTATKTVSSAPRRSRSSGSPTTCRRVARANFWSGGARTRSGCGASCRELKERLKNLRTKGGRAMTDYLRLHLLGYQQYYGVSGNSGPLRAYTRQAAKLLFKWLNRRSQRKSITWARFL